MNTVPKKDRESKLEPKYTNTKSLLTLSPKPLGTRRVSKSKRRYTTYITVESSAFTVACVLAFIPYWCFANKTVSTIRKSTSANKENTIDDQATCRKTMDTAGTKLPDAKIGWAFSHLDPGCRSFGGAHPPKRLSGERWRKASFTIHVVVRQGSMIFEDLQNKTKKRRVVCFYQPIRNRKSSESID